MKRDGGRLKGTREMEGERGGSGTLGGHLGEDRGRDEKVNSEGMTHTEGREWEVEEEAAALRDIGRAA